jgi:hypothetical protein
MSGIGGFVVSARTGKEVWIESGTSLQETIDALEGHLDPDTLKSLTRSSAVAKARHVESGYPLITKHSELADQILQLIDPEDALDADDPAVAKALLEHTERALAEYLRLRAED